MLIITARSAYSVSLTELKAHASQRHSKGTPRRGETIDGEDSEGLCIVRLAGETPGFRVSLVAFIARGPRLAVFLQGGAATFINRFRQLAGLQHQRMTLRYVRTTDRAS